MGVQRREDEVKVKLTATLELKISSKIRLSEREKNELDTLNRDPTLEGVKARDQFFRDLIDSRWGALTTSCDMEVIVVDLEET